MTTIILSYRREDTSWIAGRIHDRLKSHYGNDSVFMDIDSIPFGLDFREHIHESLENCDILLAIIGPDWTAPNEGGQARIFDETDWVRIEIEAALAKKVPVIPVLIDGTRLPPARDLPEGVRDIVFRQAADVDAGRDFHPHMDRLIGVMDQLLARAKSAESMQHTVGSSAPSKEKAAKPKPSQRPPFLKPRGIDRRDAGSDGADQPDVATPRNWRTKAWYVFGSLQGRVGRLTFVFGLIASLVVMHLLTLVVGLPYNEVTGYDGMPPIVLVFPLLWIWVVIALGSKRLHDLDWPGWPVAIPLVVGMAVPYLGFAIDLAALEFFSSVVVVSLLLLSPLSFMRGTVGPNRYGPDPLATDQTDAMR